MRQAKQSAGAAAIGDEETAGDQPIGQVDVTRIAQRIAADGAGGGGFLLLVDLDQRQQQAGQGFAQARRQIGNKLFLFARDRAFESAERVIDVEQQRLVVFAAAILEQRLERELQQRQRAGMLRGGFEKIGEIAILALLQRQARRAHRPVDDLADIRRARRLHIEAAAFFLEAKQDRIALELGIEIVAQRRDDPDAAGTR